MSTHHQPELSFCPVFAVETMGPWGYEGNHVFQFRCAKVKTNESKIKSFIQQRIRIVVEKTNAGFLTGLFGTQKKWQRFFLLSVVMFLQFYKFYVEQLNRLC